MTYFSSLGRGLLAAVLLLAAAPRLAQAQTTPGVGIGTTTPNASAALDVSSTTKGLLPPRLTQAQRDAINPAATAAGLTIYNTTTNKLNTWNGTSWEEGVATSDQPTSTVTFAYTGAPQTYTVPAGVTSLRVDAGGSRGSSSYLSSYRPGLGARVQATLAVTPGEVLTVYVAGSSRVYIPGYNGGTSDPYGDGGGGGGASDLRRSPTAPSTSLADRILVAAGGGGAGSNATGAGGNGGTPNGGNGGGSGGTGATPDVAGSPNGSLGQGGSPVNQNSGGGGGGYYGGGGGGSGSSLGGGGGGSSWVIPAGSSNVTMTVRASYSNDGYVTLTTFNNPAPALDGSNFVNVPGDNLGNHTATQNLNLANYQLTGSGGSQGLAISNTGNVGIGITTTTTAQKLDVDGGILARSNSAISNQGAYLQWNRSGSQGETWLLNQQGGGAGGIVFGRSDQSNNATEWARFNGSGNLGLGTTNASQKLDVRGNLRLGDDGGNSATGTGQAIEWVGPGVSTDLVGIYRVNPAADQSQLRVVVGDGADANDRFVVGRISGGTEGGIPGGTFTPSFTVRGDGTVGIGTSAPAAGLHVDVPESGSSTALGVLLSGGTSGNPSIELRGSGNKSPYLDFVENAGRDYSTRLISQSGTLALLWGNTGTKPTNLLNVDAGIQATAFNTTSDARFKTNVRPLGSALASVLALRGVRYDWNALGVRHGGTAGAPQVGLLAQEVEKIYPELVSTDKDGYKAVNYAQLTPVLIEALKEQQQQIEALRAEAGAAKAEAAAANTRAVSAETKATQATATLETFEARLRRLEAAGGGQARK